MGYAIDLIRLLSRALTLIIFADIIVSYILSPYHPFRKALDSIVQPMLAPIRRIMPPSGMFDFSPFVLLIVIQLVERILISLLI
ncbi:MAG: YggT family protein [Anaerolineaceae bacterium]|nr:MAG: YggT family protein [Anaerolineaceae bacterium]